MSKEWRERLAWAAVFVLVLALMLGYCEWMEWRARASVEQVVTTGEAGGVADVPKEVEDGMAIFGWDEVGTVGQDTAMGHPRTGTVYPFKTGSPVAAYYSTGNLTWPNWPNPDANMTLDDRGGCAEGELLWSAYCVYNAETLIADKIVVHLASLVGPSSDPPHEIQAALYDQSDWSLVAHSDTVEVPTSETGAWYEFTLTTTPTLTEGVSYGLMLWANPDTGGEFLVIPYDCFADYVAKVTITDRVVAAEPANAGGGPDMKHLINIEDGLIADDSALALAHLLAVGDVVEASGRLGDPTPPPYPVVHMKTVADVVECAEPERPTLVSPCLGRYIDIETMLGLPKR